VIYFWIAGREHGSSMEGSCASGEILRGDVTRSYVCAPVSAKLQQDFV